MRIAILYDYLGRSRGGVEAWIYHAGAALVGMGHSVTAVANHPGATPPSDAMPQGTEVLWLRPVLPSRVPGFSLAKRRRELTSQIAPLAGEFDMFWSRSYMMTQAACATAVRQPVAFIQATPLPFYMEYSDEKSTGLLARIRKQAMIRQVKIMEREAMVRSSVLVYLSQARMMETLDYYGQEFRGKSYVIPPGVDLGRFRPDQSSWTGKGELKIVTVCRLSREKNLGCLIKAMSGLKAAGIPVKSTVVGDGPMLHEWQEEARRCGVSDCVYFVGEKSNVEDYYRQSHLFVLPSTYEGFGSVYIEAMASGLPCIAIRNIPGRILVATDEIIRHAHTGLLIDDNSHEMLADAISYAYHHPEKSRRWAAASRDLCTKEYDWSVNMTRLIAACMAHSGRSE